MRTRIESNLTLFELIIGIIIFYLLCQIGMIFTPDILYYSLGLIIGAVMAICMACHMNYSIKRALDLSDGGASAVVRKDMAIRYAVITIILIVLMVINFASPITAFVGIMGLKIGAYIQPFTHRLISLKLLGFVDPVYEEPVDDAGQESKDSIEHNASSEHIEETDSFEKV